MALQATNPTTTKSWKKLQSHFQDIKSKDLRELFASDNSRANDLTIKWDDFYVDFSKNRISTETINLLTELADEVDLKDAISKYFEGDVINATESRAVLHTALRASKSAQVFVDGENIIPEVYEVRQKIKNFTKAIVTGDHKGFTGKTITDVVNIGIGGSDLGPAMVVDSLQYYKNHLSTHFVLESQPKEAVSKHFVAVSTNIDSVKAFGIDEGNIFPMKDWVGGRFSLWSAVGLSISLALGYENFESLLTGARKMDEHFRDTDLDQNIPVISALLTIWYNNFFNAESEAIIPYTQYLNQFATYLQQGIMESNGKYVDRTGKEVDYQTGTIIWGEPGTNSQHAFFQLIHQGTKLIPADFIGFVESLHGNKDHHDKLMSNYFAQTEALMNGKTNAEVSTELKEQNLSEKEIEKLLPYKVFKGNKPTTSILIQKLTPESLGKLIAMYEHKIFVQGIIWNIYSYDQFGVELGKQLAKTILKELEVGKNSTGHDSSTQNLIDFYKNNC